MCEMGRKRKSRQSKQTNEDTVIVLKDEDFYSDFLEEMKAAEVNVINIRLVSQFYFVNVISSHMTIIGLLYDNHWQVI